MRTPAIKGLALSVLLILLFSVDMSDVAAQARDDVQHRRGKLWETIWNTGYYGDPGAWDFLSNRPKGLYPGFTGFHHPVGNEFLAVNTFANANHHNFRSGIWIVSRDMLTPGNPPDFPPQSTPFELYKVGNESYGVQENRPNILLHENFLESDDFDPKLPEEMSEATFETNIGLTAEQRTYVWGFPNYDDFIIFDYIFTNTGNIVSTSTGDVVPNTDQFQQTLKEVYFVFESAVSVSTKSQINFYTDLDCVQAGAFGWQPETYHDFYEVTSDETLTFSYNYNGGIRPPPNNCGHIKENEQWKRFFGDELQSPSAFGQLALYASPKELGGAERSSAKPDVLRIESHKGGTFKGQDIDHERFKHSGGNNLPKKQFYDFAREPSLQEGLGNKGDRFNFFFHIYGPYTIAPGESVRFVLAEIAGAMDYQEAVAGDTLAFPDSTIAAIYRNADHARNAVNWGMGASVDGMPLAADVPEPPPAPNTVSVNASVGSEFAAIAVTWDDVAETTTTRDGAGNVYYDGASDLDGYRIYRSRDFQYNPGNPGEPTFRGAWWNLIADVPISEVDQYWDEQLGLYKIVDEDVDFGFQYGYYVAAYDSDPRPWTSANGTVVSDLPELESGEYNRSQAASASVGPVESFDIYVAPNPFVFGDPERSFGISDPYRIEFRNLPEQALIRIYSLAGDLVKTINHRPDEIGNVFGSAAWDQRSDSGLLVAPGVYIYYIESRTEGVSDNMTGKIMIIR